MRARRVSAPCFVTDGRRLILVVNGDIWSDFDFSQLQAPTNADALLVMVSNPPHHPEGDFHLQDNGFLTPDGADKLTFSGISLLHRRLFDELDDAAGKLGLVLRRAMARNRVTGLHHNGQWVDVGTPERLQSLDQWLHERARTS